MAAETKTSEAGASAAPLPLTEGDMHEFIECARYGELEDVESYVADGADVNFQGHGGSTALHKAAANGHVEVVRFLASKGAKLLPNESASTPLHWAAMNGQGDTVKLLLELYDDSVDVLAKNSFGRSAMTEALSRGHEDVARQILMHKSADVPPSSAAAAGGAGGPSAGVGEGSGDGDGDGFVEEETDDEVGEEGEGTAAPAGGEASAEAAGAGAGAASGGAGSGSAAAAAGAPGSEPASATTSASEGSGAAAGGAAAVAPSTA